MTALYNLPKVAAFIIAVGITASVNAQTMPIYLNLNSHNETNDPNDYSNASTYAQVKSTLLQIADTVSVNGARWNMQVESNFINGCLTNESGATNPNDLLDSLDNLPQFEIDPHNHFDPIFSSPTYNPYNYADLAHLLDSCGLQSPRKNMGGFLWQTGSDWMPYQGGAPGNTYTNYTWQPNVVWGGGSPGHTNDYNVYGLWKPNGASMQFPVHNPLRHLVCIGNGCSNVISDSTPISDNINQLIELINYVSSLPYDPNAYWTASVQFNFRDINMPGLADSISELIHAMQPYVNSGQVVWMTITEKYDYWYTIHTNANDYFQERCDSLSLGIAVADAFNTSLYPNPFTDQITIQSGVAFNSIVIYDLMGKEIYREDTETEFNTVIDASKYDRGYYFVCLTYGDGTMRAQRVVKM